MIEYVAPGEKIEIDIRLAEATTGRFVKAILEDIQGNVYATVTLSDIGSGRYFNNSISKPQGRLTALFEVYLDSAMTNRDTDFADDSIAISYDNPPLLNVLNKYLATGQDIMAEIIEDPDIDVYIETSEELSAIVQDEQELQSLIESDEEISSLLNNDEETQVIGD